MDTKKLVREVTAGAVAAGSLTAGHPAVVPKEVFDGGGRTSEIVSIATLGTYEPTAVSGAASVSLRGTAQGTSGTHAWLTDQSALTRLVGRNAVEQLREAVRASAARKDDG